MKGGEKPKGGIVEEPVQKFSNILHSMKHKKGVIVTICTCNEFVDGRGNN